jgi:hypothetical protein
MIERRIAGIKANLWISAVGLIVALLMALAPGCATVTPVPSPAADCDAVCLHGNNLGCSWATPTPAGATCVQVCQQAQTGPLPWSMSCSVQAESCAAVDAWNR